MLPIGRGQGELWHGNQLLCQVEYDISPPLFFVSVENTQRIEIIVHDYECEKLTDVAGLTLVLADRSRHRLPRPLNFVSGDGYLECFLSTDIFDDIS